MKKEKKTQTQKNRLFTKYPVHLYLYSVILCNF